VCQERRCDGARDPGGGHALCCSRAAAAARAARRRAGQRAPPLPACPQRMGRGLSHASRRLAGSRGPSETGPHSAAAASRARAPQPPRPATAAASRRWRAADTAKARRRAGITPAPGPPSRLVVLGLEAAREHQARRLRCLLGHLQCRRARGVTPRARGGGCLRRSVPEAAARGAGRGGAGRGGRPRRCGRPRRAALSPRAAPRGGAPP
jgi:hypothetical protein